MDILKPPQSYIEFRCAIHGLQDKDMEDAKSKFYRKFQDSKQEILNFFNYLYRVRNEMSLPIEKIVRKGELNSESMMIYDIEYWKEDGETKQRKIYIPLKEPVYKERLKLPYKDDMGEDW